MPSLHNFVTTGCVAALLGLAQTGFSQAEIVATHYGTSGSLTNVVAGDTLIVRVAVSNNTSGRNPSSTSFRVRFNETQVLPAASFASEAQLGIIGFSPADEDDNGATPGKFRDVATLGPIGNSSIANPLFAQYPLVAPAAATFPANTFPGTITNPVLLDLYFVVQATVSAPYTISIQVDPGPDEMIGNADDGKLLPWTTIIPPGAGEVGSITVSNAIVTPTPTPSPTPSPVPTASPSPSPSPTPIATPSPSPTAVPTPSPTATNVTAVDDWKSIID